MSIYRLPDTLPLHTEVSPVLKFKDGALVAETERTYPSLFAKLEDVKTATEKERKGRRPRKEITDKWPVAMDEKGLWTDFRWWVFQAFSEDQREFDFRHKSLMEELARDPSLWDVRCPAMRGHETLTGQLMAAYGERMGAATRRATYSPTQTMQNHPLARLLDGKTDAQILGFEDRGRTLLDLATSHQQWDMAEDLWKKGARWSTPHIESGQVLEGLILGWMGLRKSTYEGWLKGSDHAQTEDLRVEWLETWLGRYEALGAALPVEASLDRRYRAYLESGGNYNRFVDTPASLFLAQMFRMDGPRSLDPKLIPEFALKMLDRWWDFWADQGVDLLSERIPKPTWAGEGVPAETVGVLEQWKNVAGLEELMLEKKMAFHLSESSAPDRSKKPGARF